MALTVGVIHSAPALAQSTNASLDGTITDDQGGVLPGAPSFAIVEGPARSRRDCRYRVGQQRHRLDFVRRLQRAVQIAVAGRHRHQLASRESTHEWPMNAAEPAHRVSAGVDRAGLRADPCGSRRGPVDPRGGHVGPRSDRGRPHRVAHRGCLRDGPADSPDDREYPLVGPACLRSGLEAARLGPQSRTLLVQSGRIRGRCSIPGEPWATSVRHGDS